MLNHVEFEGYAAGIRALIKAKAVDVTTLARLRAFNPIEPSAAMVEARLKEILSEADFNPMLPLYIGEEPNLPERPWGEAFRKFASAAKAREGMEAHFSADNDQMRVQLKLFWRPATYLYCWREKRPAAELNPPYITRDADIVRRY